MTSDLTLKQVEGLIHTIREQRVMLDRDLAELYGVQVKRLNQQIRRNPKRFPKDFMFQMTPEEVKILRSQNVTLGLKWGRYSKYLPFAFTEQGVAMLSSVLSSDRAVQVNVEIMRAFVRLRHWALNYHQLAKRITDMEGRYDGHFKIVFRALRQILKDEARSKVRIGFE